MPRKTEANLAEPSWVFHRELPTEIPGVTRKVAFDDMHSVGHLGSEPDASDQAISALLTPKPSVAFDDYARDLRKPPWRKTVGRPETGRYSSMETNGSFSSNVRPKVAAPSEWISDSPAPWHATKSFQRLGSSQRLQRRYSRSNMRLVMKGVGRSSILRVFWKFANTACISPRSSMLQITAAGSWRRLKRTRSATSKIEMPLSTK